MPRRRLHRPRAAACPAAALAAVLLAGCGAAHKGAGPLRRGAPVVYMPGSIHQVARGSAAGSVGYSVFVERYGFEHREYSALGITVFEGGGATDGTNFTPSPAEPFSWSLEVWCPVSAHMHAIVYGLLTRPGERAYALLGRRRYRMHTAAIPARYRLAGAAAYVALPGLPSRVLATSPAGALVATRDLEPPASERCKPGAGILIFEPKHSKTSG